MSDGGLSGSDRGYGYRANGYWRGCLCEEALPNAVAFGPLFPYEEELAHEANEFLSIEKSGRKMTEIFVKGLYILMTRI